MSTDTGQACSAFELRGISKTYGAVKALKGVCFDCAPGEVHALVGENGAGKSTLIGVVGGVVQPESGEIYVHGQLIRSPTAAEMRAQGVAIAYQDDSLMPDLSIANNLAFALPPHLGSLSGRKLREWAQQQLSPFGRGFDTRVTVSELGAADRQVVEIMKAIASRPRILLLDEPTATLGTQDVELLFNLLRKLAKDGVAIVYISHKLPEVLEIADRITVLRDGEDRGTWGRGTVSEDELVTEMIGRSLAVAFPPPGTPDPSAVLLRVEGLSTRGVHQLSFDVHRGEILGLGGLQGNGQRDVLRALAGLEKGSGRVTLGGHAIHLGNSARARGAGLAFISSDRRGESVAPSLSVQENLLASIGEQVTTAGFVSRKREQAIADKAIASLGIKTPSPRLLVDQLSGGNQQKVALGRALLAEPKVLIIDEPTQGIDAGARVDFYVRLRGAIGSDQAAIISSSDSLELSGLCDRVLVMSGGQIVADLPREQLSESSIIGAAVRTRVRRNQQAEKTAGSRRRLSTHWAVPLLVLFIATIVFSLYTGIRAPRFVAGSSLGDLAYLLIPLTFAGLAQGIVLFGGGFDLSIGPVMSFCTVILSYLTADPASPANIALGAVACLVMGACVGTINGMLIVRLKIHPLAATLATFTAVIGVGFVLRPTPSGLIGQSFTHALRISAGHVPLALLIVGAIAVVGEYVLRRRPLGRSVLGLGSRRLAAGRNGVNTPRMTFMTYVAAGILASVGGIFFATSTGVGDASVATSYTLQGLTAVVLGGTAITGGRGSALGALFGGLLLATIISSGGFLNWSAAVNNVFTGALLIIAIGIYTQIQRGDSSSAFSSLLRRLRGDRPVEQPTEPAE